VLGQLSVVLTADTALARNPHIRPEVIRVSALQWALLIRVRHGSAPRDLAWDLGRGVFGTTIEAYRLLARQLLSVAGRRTCLSGPGRHPHGPADQWMAKSARVYPSALTVGWMKLFSIIRVACASAALISGPVTFGLCLTCVNARFCAWP